MVVIGDQSGWNSRSGKNRLNSIMIPAVIVNQIAAKTGAVVRNFFIVVEPAGESVEGKRRAGLSGARR
jgi:hypothetical protein